MATERQLRGVCRGKITSMEKTIMEALKDETTLTVDLTVMKQQLLMLDNELKTWDAKLDEEQRDESTTKKDYEDYLKYKDVVLKCSVRIDYEISERQKVIDEQKEMNKPSNVASNQISITSSKLPKLSLHKFSGRLDEWTFFWDQFSRLVHEETSLSKAEKFEYLRVSLKGNAQKEIASIPYNSECYDAAIIRLKEEFGDPQRICEAHCAKLLSVRPVKSCGDVQELRSFNNFIQDQLIGLKAIGVNLEHVSALLFPVLKERLPSLLIHNFKKYLRQQKKNQEAVDRIVTEKLKHLKANGESDEENDAVSTTSSLAIESSFEHVKLLLEFIGEELKDIQSSSHMEKSQKYEKCTTDNFFADNPRKTITDGNNPDSKKKIFCCFCSAVSHNTRDCKARKTLSMTVEERKNKLKEAKHCYVCLYKGHYAKNCKVRIQCVSCSRRHHSLVCSPKKSENLHLDTNKVSNNTCDSFAKSGSSMLLTVMAHITTHDGKSKTCRILFDTGSEKSFITESLAKAIEAKIESVENLQIGLLTEKHENVKSNIVKVKLSSMAKNISRVIFCNTIPSICEKSHVPRVNKDIVKKLQEANIKISDQINASNNIKPIDILIGMDNFDLFLPQDSKMIEPGLWAIKTLLGWTLGGGLKYKKSKKSSSFFLEVHEDVTPDHHESSTLKKLWELDAIGITGEDIPMDNQEDFFRKFSSTINYTDKRYSVPLFWKEEVELQDNYPVAYARLMTLVQRLKSLPSLHERYDKEIKNLVELGYAEIVTDIIEPERSYYMPHREILKEERSTTKLRIVYDASSKQKGCSSLNDNLEVGPNMNPDILAILMNFRWNPVAIAADIEKAFLQIAINPEDRDCLRLLWWNNCPTDKEENLVKLRMKRVSFGVNCSPAQLAVTLRYHFAYMSPKFPDTAKRLARSTYVDDVIEGFSSVDEAKQFFIEANEIFEEASMNIRKWSSNNKALNDFLCQKTGCQVETLGTIMGVNWDRDKDILFYNLKKVIQLCELMREKGPNRRRLLQIVASIFDPLFLLIPFVITGKILLQKTWALKLKWDEILSTSLIFEVEKWISMIPNLQEINIPRYYFQSSINLKPVNFMLHFFSDASINAYCAAVYLVTEWDNGIRTSQLITAKSRLAPLKSLNIPRLELLAALLSARLFNYINSNLTWDISKYYFWTDSSVVMYYVNSDPFKWNIWVKNRVKEIQRLIQDRKFNHVAGSENPADLGTRGISMLKLKNSQIWWHGPHWLQYSEDKWPRPNFMEEILDNELEKKIEITSYMSATINSPLELPFGKARSFISLLNIVVYVIRIGFALLQRCNLNEVLQKPIQQQERKEVVPIVIRNAQKVFSSEHKTLVSGGSVAKSSPLYLMKPFIDSEGIIRMGGRLDEYEGSIPRHPILLKGNTELGRLIILHIHKNNFHCGVTHTLVKIRELDFWLIEGRKCVKNLLGKCIICNRLHARPVKQEFCSPPKERINQSAPFSVVGLDFAGPLFVKTQATYKEELQKVYILLFTCASTRSVHLELTQSLAFDQFVMAFRRFVARKQMPEHIYSDNAKTFVKAKLELTELFSLLQSTNMEETLRQTNWHFGVERASWHGGFFERMIGTVKVALKKTLKNSRVGFTELQTILTEVEAMVNSRPLTSVTENPMDFSVLCPADFLLPFKRNTFPDIDVKAVVNSSSKINLHQRFQFQKTLTLKIWKKWHGEYLATLRNFHLVKPIKDKSKMFSDGQLVFIAEQGVPRLKWKLGRINKVKIGRDGKIRTCWIKTSQGVLRRTTQHLIPLELEDFDTESHTRLSGGSVKDGMIRHQGYIRPLCTQLITP